MVIPYLIFQQIENEESTAEYEEQISQEGKKHPDQNKFSKISVTSRYDSSSLAASRYKTSSIKSSDYNEAMFKENQLNLVGVDKSTSEMFKGGVTMLPNGSFISKHDPLLNSLKNAEKLSEYEGVGDLSGGGLLINNSVANSIRSYSVQQLSQKKKHK